ncbi:hypothetical protein [Reinekea sp. G2M2-21]|uniref:hypothetical protein n=1 Tax=Reinekea sp. G2M2-21 TaxID=2788942 RepID=UPI0018AA3530|nr:hypothetical protein [Reinekea sp. G2M2-21]
MIIYRKSHSGCWKVDTATMNVVFEDDSESNYPNFAEKHPQLFEVIQDYCECGYTVDDTRIEMEWFQRLVSVYLLLRKIKQTLLLELNSESSPTSLLDSGTKFCEVNFLTKDIPLRLPAELRIAKSIGRARKFRNGSTNLSGIPQSVKDSDFVRAISPYTKTLQEVWLPFGIARSISLNGYLPDYLFDCSLEVTDEVVVRFSTEAQYYWNSANDASRRAYLALIKSYMPEDLVRYISLSFADMNSTALNCIFTRGLA